MSGGGGGLVGSEIWRPFQKNEIFFEKFHFRKKSFSGGLGPNFHIWA